MQPNCATDNKWQFCSFRIRWNKIFCWKAGIFVLTIRFPKCLSISEHTNCKKLNAAYYTYKLWLKCLTGGHIYSFNYVIPLWKTPSKSNSICQCNVNQKQPPEVFYKKMFLKISQNSQENICARVSLNTFSGLSV